MALKDLIEKRKDILLAEIGALIHDLGKLSNEFVEKSGFGGNAKSNNNHTKQEFYHEKVWLDLDLIKEYIINSPPDKFLEMLLALILKEPLKRFKELESKISSKNMTSHFSASDLPAWAKNDPTLKSHGKISSAKIKDFEKTLSENTAFLRYNYMKGKYFVLDLNILYYFYPNKSPTKNFFKVNILKEWPLGILLSLHHRNDVKVFNFGNSNLPKEMGLFLPPYGADSIDSAIDKMVSEDDEYVKQSKDYTHIATAFGYEDAKIDLNLPDTDKKSLTKIRKDYANDLVKELNSIYTSSDTEKLMEMMERRRELLNKTREAFLKALGETRLPANDVTLWDHSFSVASLFKAAISEVILNKWKDPQDIKWKLLGIRFNGSDFYESVPKISDVLGRKSLVKKILDIIRDLLEVVIPAGNEIYRDENGSVFLMPESLNLDESFDDDSWDKISSEVSFPAKLNYKGEWESENLGNIISSKPKDLHDLIRQISSYVSNGIFVPNVEELSPSRGAINLGELIDKNPGSGIDIHKLEELWKNRQLGHEKCTVCGLRPVPLTYEEYEELKSRNCQGLSEEEEVKIKAYERKVCVDCLKLAQNRVQEWYDNKKWNKENPERPSFDTTIWLDEVADKYNRVALIYVSFDLEKWLNGEMLNTFLSKPLLDSNFSKDFGNYNIKSYDDLVKLIKESFDKGGLDEDLSVNTKGGSPLKVKDLLKVLGIKADNKDMQQIFDEIVVSKEPNWKGKYSPPLCKTKGGNYHKAAVLLLYLTRKHPSFARLRRIWEATRNFGIEIFNDSKENLKAKRVKIEFLVGNSLKERHTYYFKDKSGRQGELVVLPNNKSSPNNNAVILTSKDFQLSEGEDIEIYDENSGEKIADVTIDKVDKVDYHRILPYQFEPSKTLFFVPLQNAWDIIKKIKKEYEKQFNKVQNRLPVRIGFVAFNKKSPVFAVLDAAKKMCDAEIKPERFTICDIKPNNKEIEIDFNNGRTYSFSYSLKDPNKEDLFYPYFMVTNGNGWKTYVYNEWKVIKHLKELKQGDEVLFYQSKFDFLWLDTNTRRFDAGNPRKHWLFKKFSPKPYNIKNIEDFERLREILIKTGITQTQIMNTYELLIGKMLEWGVNKVRIPIRDEVFEDFVSNIILSNPMRLKIESMTSKGAVTKEDFGFIKNSMLNGIFIDFIDMWHTIFKYKDLKGDD